MFGPLPGIVPIRNTGRGVAASRQGSVPLTATRRKRTLVRKDWWCAGPGRALDTGGERDLAEPLGDRWDTERSGAAPPLVDGFRVAFPVGAFLMLGGALILAVTVAAELPLAA
jgi:hypothetical protein